MPEFYLRTFDFPKAAHHLERISNNRVRNNVTRRKTITRPENIAWRTEDEILAERKKERKKQKGRNGTGWVGGWGIPLSGAK
jgi:hypothetical protein